MYSYKIIPQPAGLTILEGAGLDCASGLGLAIDGTDPCLLADFKRFLSLSHIPSGADNIQIRTGKDPTDESYTLEIHSGQVQIDSSGPRGAFYALQTLKQLILQSDGGQIAALRIADRPRFPFRGFMLDTGRYYYPVEKIKRFLDWMALQKLNTFHWHLTEDQGWRIEIKKYPLLTEYGSRRSHTNFGLRPHGGFYTQEEIREIVRYAHSLFIRVIPEIDLPGHMQAAIACYPELSCFDRKLPVATHWGVKHDILCAGKESTFQFLFNVLDEVAELFPDGWIHLGGDEAVKMRWQLCPRCQQKMRELGLETEDDLQLWFMSRVDNYLAQKGIRTLMWSWDGIPPKDLLNRSIGYQLCGMAPKTVGTFNREMENRRAAVQSSAFPYYLDFPYGWNNLRQTYDFDPIPDGLSEKAAQSLLGVEGPLWTEYVPNMKKAEYCTFPRLCAIAESGWTPADAKNYARFCAALDPFYQLLALYGVRHAATEKQYMPAKLRAKGYSLWFNRRQLHWQGLHNLIDDARVARMAAKGHSDHDNQSR